VTNAKIKRKPAGAAGKAGHNTLPLKVAEGSSRERCKADLVLAGVAGNAFMAQAYGAGTFGELSLPECVASLQDAVEKAQSGDMRHVEAMLVAQAAALNAIFTEMARRAALNMGEYIEATERYMRLGLKAQGQCRATLETLAAIKNPPVVFARQANIAHGPQQVNNAMQHGERLDNRAAGTAGRADPQLAPVGAIQRAEVGSG
jgi:hypothetical protein